MADTPSELKQGVLGLGEAFAESFALLSLALASSLATSVVAANAGVAAPWVTSSPAPAACAWPR